MPKISGYGGYLVIVGSGNTRGPDIHNSSWTLTVERTIDDVTDSRSHAIIRNVALPVARGLPIIRKVQSLEIEIPEDSDAFPYALGLTEGATLSLWLKRGAYNGAGGNDGIRAWHRIDNTIVRSIRVTNDQQRARRVQITCEYGVVTWNAAPPNPPT